METEADPPLDISAAGCRRSILCRTAANDTLSRLNESTHFTASLVALQGTRGVYVHRVHGNRDGQREADMGLGAGDEIPLHCTAGGKALLIALPATESERLIKTLTLTRYTSLTVSRQKDLIGMVKAARGQGVAIAESEYVPGVGAIAAAVRPSSRRLVLAVELTLPRGRSPLAQWRIGQRCHAVLSAAKEISHQIRPPATPTRPTPDEYEQRAQEMVSLRKQGLSYAQIGKRYGITRQAVEHIVKRCTKPRDS